MSATQLDPRAVADTLGVTTLELATFLRAKASDLMVDAAGIAANDPWYAHEDAESRFQDLDELVGQAKSLMAAAFECNRAFDEDNPEADHDED